MQYLLWGKAWSTFSIDVFDGKASVTVTPFKMESWTMWRWWDAELEIYLGRSTRTEEYWNWYSAGRNHETQKAFSQRMIKKNKTELAWASGTVRMFPGGDIWWVGGRKQHDSSGHLIMSSPCHTHIDTALLLHTELLLWQKLLSTSIGH